MDSRYSSPQDFLMDCDQVDMTSPKVLMPIPKVAIEQPQLDCLLNWDILSNCLTDYGLKSPVSPTSQSATFTTPVVNVTKDELSGCLSDYALNSPVSPTSPEEFSFSQEGNCSYRSESYTCPFPDCKKSFAKKYCRESHLIVHTRSKDFKCACSKGFARKHDLYRHIRCVHKTTEYRKFEGR